MFRTVPLSISRSFSLHTQRWYMSYRFANSMRAGSGRNVLILLASCLQTCMTYTIAVCGVKNSCWWTEELSEICSYIPKNKFKELVHLVGLLYERILSNAFRSDNKVTSPKWLYNNQKQKPVWKTFTPEWWQLLTECIGVQCDKLEIPMTFWARRYY